MRRTGERAELEEKFLELDSWTGFCFFLALSLAALMAD